MEQTIQRLSALHNRMTRYEVAAVNGEQRILIGYTSRHSRFGLLKACQSRGQQIIDTFGVTDDDVFTPAKKAADGFTIGAWQFRFTGRTERDAIMEGELVQLGASVESRTAAALAAYVRQEVR